MLIEMGILMKRIIGELKVASVFCDVADGASTR